MNAYLHLPPKTTDKYHCQKVLDAGYKAFISEYFPNKKLEFSNYELVICDGNCSTVSFNNTCAPITYRYGKFAEEICVNCDDSLVNLNCGNKMNNMAHDDTASVDLLSDQAMRYGDLNYDIWLY